MINWTALHASCVERISFYKRCMDIYKERTHLIPMKQLGKLAGRYETLLEFIDTRIQTSINQPI